MMISEENKTHHTKNVHNNEHMNIEEELRLSFYKEIASVNERHGVVLVQNSDTGKIYVKKTLNHYDRSIFDFIRWERFKGVPVITELIESDETLIVIEDYISGHSIEELLEKGPLDRDDAIYVINQLCDILKPFHSCEPSIIHRDIKASNVIIDNEGKVYLIDFDASKVVIRGKNRDTELIGTEEYAAPEQYGFGQSDMRTDIYALGILMNKMLTGKFPSEELYKGELSDVVKKATEIDPDKRYQNVEELKNAVSECCDSVTYSYVISDDVVEPDTAGVQGNTLKGALSHLPYPIRELPGFRSGNPLLLCAAVLWYAALIALGFFAVVKNPEYTAAQNKLYDIATFALFFIPTLYLGNYLGTRDRLPWRKSENLWVEVIRIILGVGLIALILVIVVSIVSLIFGI